MPTIDELEALAKAEVEVELEDDDEEETDPEQVTKLINCLHDCYQLLSHMQALDDKESMLTRNRRIHLTGVVSEAASILGYEDAHG